MDERLFAQLADWLAAGPVVLASVTDTRGATPRRRGSRMLIARGANAGSVGGGLAEARVLAAAQALLADAQAPREVPIDLSGREGSAGVCGGRMAIRLSRWEGEHDRAQAHAIADALAAGERVALTTPDAPAAPREMLHPDARLLIVGAGHCGHALHALAGTLDFDRWVHDARPDCFAADRFAGARVLCGEAALLAQALDTAREVYAVLLNRDYAADVAALDVLCRRPPAFLGMMGSAKRIAQVRIALPQHEAALAHLTAPVGLELDAQTPAEIAVSIAAQLVAVRRARARGVGG